MNFDSDKAREQASSPLGGERAGVRGAGISLQALLLKNGGTPHPQSFSPPRGEGRKKPSSVCSVLNIFKKGIYE